MIWCLVTRSFFNWFFSNSLGPVDVSVPPRPCLPSPCGVNTNCRERNGLAICECIAEYRGNPYEEGCQPECLVNNDCPRSQACIRTKCQDPCSGTCGVGAVCTVSNHIPICTCPYPLSGDAFSYCQQILESKITKKLEIFSFLDFLVWLN